MKGGTGMKELYDELERTCERATKELCDLNNRLDTNKNMLSPTDVDMMDKLTHTIKSIKKIMQILDEYDEENQNRYSGGMYYSQPMWDRRYSGNSYYGTYTVATGDHDHNYSGRRSSRHMYSRDSERDNMMSELDTMLNNARDDREAEVIRKVMSKL